MRGESVDGSKEELGEERDDVEEGKEGGSGELKSSQQIGHDVEVGREGRDRNIAAVGCIGVRLLLFSLDDMFSFFVVVFSFEYVSTAFFRA